MHSQYFYLKYRLRLFGLTLLARISHLFGMDWPRIGDMLGRESIIAQARALSPLKSVNYAEKALDVVFLTMMGGNHRLCSTEVVLGRILSARGHRVRYVLCDQMLPVCEVKKLGKEEHWKESCAKCHIYGSKLLGGAGNEVLPVSKLIQDSTNNGDWTETVDAALLKHHHVGVLLDTPQVDKRRQMFRKSAQVSAVVGQNIAQMKPDRVVMSHGIYSTWGPAREVLNEASIPVLTYGEGKKKDTIKFNWTTSADWWDVSQEWQKVKDIPLTQVQEDTINEYLGSRRKHTQDVRVYNFGEEESLAATLKRLQLKPNKLTFVLFTNVLWDAASAQREIAFKNPIEWVIETISWFDKHPEKQLVVKIHPSEVVIGTNQPFASIIDQHFPKLPENVRVIKPEEKVNSWSIMRVATLGLVHTSTIGMELPLEGIPCAVVSKTHFRGRGFTMDIDSREEYFEILETWNGGGDADKNESQILAKRYAYLLFERYQLPFPFLYEQKVNDVRAFINIGEEEMLNHPSLKLFVEAFENQGEYLLDC